MLRFRRPWLGLSICLSHSPITALRVRVSQKTLRESRAYVSVAAHNVPQTTTSRYTSYAEQVVQNQRLLYAQHLRALRRDTVALHDAQHAEAKLVRCTRTNGKDNDISTLTENVKDVHSATQEYDGSVFVSSAERRLMAELGITDLMAQQEAKRNDTKQSETNSETKAESHETTTTTSTAEQRLDSLRPRIAALCHAGLRARIVPTSIVHSILDSCAINTNVSATKAVREETKEGTQSITTTRMPIDFTAYLASPAETTHLVRVLFSDDIVAALLEAMTDYLHYTRHRMHTQQLRQTFAERRHSTTSPTNSRRSSDVMMNQMLQQEQQGEAMNRMSSCYAFWRQDAARERVARQLLQLFQPLLRNANTDEKRTKDTQVLVMQTTPDTARRRLYVAVMRLAAVLGEAEYAAQLMQDVFTSLERLTTQTQEISSPSHATYDVREDTAMDITSSWQPEEVRAMCLSAIEASLVVLQTQLVLNSTSTTIASSVEATMKESTRQNDAFAHGYALFMRYMQWRRQVNNDNDEEDNTQRHASASGSLHNTLLLFPEDTMAFITYLAPCVGRADDVVSLRTLCTLFTELLTSTEVGYSEESSEAVKKAYSALLASFADLTAPFAPHDLRRTQLSRNNTHKSQSVANIVENEQCAEDACLALLENLVKTTVQNTAMSVSQDTQVTAQLMRVFAHGGHVTRALLLFNKLAAPSTRTWAMREEMVGSMLLTTSLTTLQPSTHSAAYVVAVVKSWRESFARYRSFRVQHYALTSNIIHGLVARMMLLVVESAMPAEALQERRAMLYTMLDDGLSTCEEDRESVTRRSTLVDLYAGRTFFLRCLVFLQSLVCTLKDNSHSAVVGQETARFTHGCNVLHAWYSELMSQHEAEEHLTWPLVELFCHLAQTLMRVCGEGAQRILRDMEQGILHRYVRRFTPYNNSGRMSDAQRSKSCLLDVEELHAMCTSNAAQPVKTEVIFVQSDTTPLSATKYVQHSRRAEAGSLLRAAWSILMLSTPVKELTNDNVDKTTEQQSASNASSPSACPTRPMYVITLHDYAQLCLLQTWLSRVDSVTLAHAEQVITIISDEVSYRVLSPEAERVLRGSNVSDKMNQTAAVCDDFSTATTPLGVRGVTWQSLLQSCTSTPVTLSEERSLGTAPLPTLDLSEKDSVAYWLREWIAYHSVCVSGLDFFTRSVRRGLKEADTLRLSQYATQTTNAAEAETAYAKLAKGSPFVDVDQVLSSVV